MENEDTFTTGAKITFQVDSVATTECTVTMIKTTSDKSTDALSYVHHFSLNMKRVRREIRSLTDGLYIHDLHIIQTSSKFYL